MNWKDNFEEGKELILATSSKDSKPNANICISLGFSENKLLIADCQMNTTIKNIRENQRVCIISGYFRIKGSAELFSSGEHFNTCSKILATQDNSLKMKTALVINIEEVFDLDKGKDVIL